MSDPLPSNPLSSHVRPDLPGRFNELDVLRRQWGRFASTVEGQVVPPFEVLIHPSSGCNLRCDWCIGDHVPLEIWDDQREELVLLDAAKISSDRLPDALAVPENMMKLARELVDYRVEANYRHDGREHRGTFGIENVSFSGLIGEPLIARRALVPAIEHLVDHGIRVGIFTNGVLMDEAVVEVLLGAAYVHVSIDAATPQTYAALKYGGRPAGQAMFDKAVANVARLVERRRESGSTVEINTSFVMYPQNFGEVYDAAQLLEHVGVDSLRLKQDNSGSQPLSDQQRAEAKSLVERIRAEVETEAFRLVEIHQLDNPQEMARTCSTCSITDLMAAVGSDGHLYPCNYHPRPGGFSYGSAIDTSFAQVWESQERQRMRRQLPTICPTVCDPFKNRANRLLAEAKTVVADSGIDRLEEHVADLVDGGAYVIER